MLDGGHANYRSVHGRKRSNESTVKVNLNFYFFFFLKTKQDTRLYIHIKGKKEKMFHPSSFLFLFENSICKKKQERERTKKL